MSSQSLYINSIDECVNNIIDSFYLEIIEEKEFNKKLHSQEYDFYDFISLLEKVNTLIDQNVKSYNISTIITNSDEYDKILNLLNDYVLLYFFFYVGIHMDLNKVITIINKLSNKFQIPFFKNRYLAQYSIYYKYIKEYHIVLNNNSAAALGLENNTRVDSSLIKEYKDVILSIQTIDNEVLKEIISNKEDLTHNILKIIIFREIYMQEDKLLIFKILENEEFASAEFKYIEIVDTRYDMIDYSAIESLFDIKDIRRGLAEEVFQMINDHEVNKYVQDYNIDTKINHLFKKKILIPITDEFLRFHKDSEIYDRGVGTGSKIDPKERVNKKDNTKIRYIITKINKVKDYYSPKILADNIARSEIEKNFYQPMMYRKAIIINDLEEINILRKLELQGKSVTDSNEFYDDLKYIRSYPFIEFKFTNRDSFSFSPETTITAIRYCNFEYKNDPKFPNILKSELQYRIINDNTKANIVGVAIPRFNLIDTNNYDRYNQTILPCHKLSNTMDMSLLHKNSFAVAIKKLRKLFLEDRRYSKLLYWIFNKKNDLIKLDLFDNIKQLPKDEYIKLLLGKIYDEMVNITYQIALNRINTFEYIDIKTAKNILHNLESKLVLIPRQSEAYAEIMKLIYYIKSTPKINAKDLNEDKLLGINSQFIKLPRIVLEKISLHIIKISKHEMFTDIVDDSDMYEGYLCQHTITWNSLLRYKKTNPNKFNQELYNFIKKYVTENNEKDFVCKSCYQLVDLRKYTTEIYPGSESIAISYGLETELETIQEYVKYTKAIKNMDKLIEKICYGSNISYFVGSAQQSKFRRQEVIKNIIDIVEIQYKTLYSKDTNSRKERLDRAIKNYGCSMTNFFLFKLENDIFTYSSKETDKFKLFKMNNILTYILIGILLDINLSQILYLSFDKLVNYFLFTKFGFNLFDGLYIRISNKNDIAPIKNYKLLCYVIYYISGIYAKFNMWYTEDIPFKPNNINPQIQRFVIHTFVDAINSILEVNTRENKHYIYNVFATKFFGKLNSVYDNKSSADVIEKLDSINKKKVTITVDKKLKYNISTVDAIPLKPYISDGKYMIESTLGTKQKVASYPSLKFTYDKLPDKSREELIGSVKLEEVNNSLYMDSLVKIATLYDTIGVKRNVQISSEEARKISLNELKKISEAAKNMRLKSFVKESKKTDKKMDKIDMKNIRNKEYIEQIRSKFNGEMTQVIENFVDKLESLIGKDININNNNYYLNTNVYEINHDYRGNKKSSIFILEKDQKIKLKKDEQFFGQDVYYYEDSSNQVTVYYSAIEKFLLGYKESSKDYVKLINTDCYIKIHYSLQNQLRLFGFNYVNYKLDPNIKDINAFINNIMRNRLQNLKNSLSTIQQIIYQVKNNFSGSNLNSVAKYYQTKIKSINTYDSNDEKIFKNWNILNNSIFFDNIKINSNINTKQMPNNNKYLQSENLIKFISNDDIIMYYIIEQFNILLDINSDNYTKVNLAYMIINTIFQIFRNFTNCENASYDINVKKFYHYISTKAEVSESHDEIDYSSMTEEEIEKLREEQDIDRERDEALDADQDIESTDDFGDEDIRTGERD
jgi:hypothetical protein